MDTREFAPSRPFWGNKEVFGFFFFNLYRCSRTVSMETGCQNVQLCSTILNVTFRPEDIGPLFFFPLLYMIFQLGEGVLLILIFRCYEKMKSSKGEYLIILLFSHIGSDPCQQRDLWQGRFGWAFSSYQATRNQAAPKVGKDFKEPGLFPETVLQWSSSWKNLWINRPHGSKAILTLTRETTETQNE